MDILIIGALTGKSMGVPVGNIGLVMEMSKNEAEVAGYPKKFTRISFKKTLANNIKYADCVESVEEILTQMSL